MVQTTEQAGVVPHLGAWRPSTYSTATSAPSTYSLGCCPRAMIRFPTATTPRVACCAAMTWTL